MSSSALISCKQVEINSRAKYVFPAPTAPFNNIVFPADKSGAKADAKAAVSSTDYNKIF